MHIVFIQALFSEMCLAIPMMWSNACISQRSNGRTKDRGGFILKIFICNLKSNQ